MPSNNHWYPRYVGDYMSKTQDLSLMEHGAYTVLMDYYYSTNQPLPANAQQLHRICRAFAKDEQDALQSVLDKFFFIDGNFYRNKRADEELKKRANLSAVRAEAARKRHDAKDAIAHAIADANAHAIAHTSTSTSTAIEIRDNNPLPIYRPSSSVLEPAKAKVFDFDVKDYFNEAGLARVRREVEGWCPYMLAGMFNEKVNSGALKKPTHPIGALIGWSKKYTKGKQL